MKEYFSSQGMGFWIFISLNAVLFSEFMIGITLSAAFYCNACGFICVCVKNFDCIRTLYTYISHVNS